MKRRGFFKSILGLFGLGIVSKAIPVSPRSVYNSPGIAFNEGDLIRSVNNNFTKFNREFVGAMAIEYNQAWETEIKLMQRPIPSSKT